MKLRRWVLIFLGTAGTLLLVLSVWKFYQGRVTPPELDYPVPPDTKNQKALSLENMKKLIHPDPLCYANDAISFYSYEEGDPLWEKNNKFGLYVYAEDRDFFEIAQEMVNSNGGEWGYVLIPYNMDDRDIDKWNRVFGQLVNKKLIPVVQLWKLDVDDYKEQTKEAATFLNRFVWPIKYRYVSVYNEPNDARFWFDRVDPQEYAKILNYTIQVFNQENDDFYMLNGAFNASASTTSTSLDSLEYMRQMDEAVPGIFNKLDGWASHPYPQPNFSGSPYNTGRWSIRAYEDELDYLKELGVEKQLPVFITETGWAHAEGENYNGAYPSVSKVGEYMKIAYEEVWLPDDRVRAVMPFTVRYNPPFDHFSWVNKDNVPYLHYNVIKNMDKIAGDPPSVKVSEKILSECVNVD